MLEQVLLLFLPNTHPLTLASDPDEVLSDDELHNALVAHGFRIIEEADLVALRAAVHRAQPWSIETLLIVVTRQAVNELPYDLWQQGHHVDLALSRLFPSFTYPVVRQLSHEQRRRGACLRARATLPGR